MSGHRKALRSAAQAAMRTAFPAISERSLHSLGVNSEALPCWAIGTPREASSPSSKDSLRRSVMLLVVIKRQGDELEDELDLDAAAAEAALGPALNGACQDAELNETTIDIAREGSRTVGQIMLRYQCAVETETEE